MKLRRLGKSGFEVSEIGLGCWQLGGDFGPVGDDRAMAVLQAAHEAGIQFWDTADVYGAGTSERRIAAYRKASGARVIVATKVGRDGSLYPGGYTKAKVRGSLEGSARRLRVDHIDLAQLHCVPPAVLAAGELLGWMEDFKRDGLIRAWGASVETIDEALSVVTHPGLASLQVIFNVFRQNATGELFPAAVENDVGIIVRLPLASGVLSGRMSADQSFAETDHRHYNRNGEAFSQGETFSGIAFEKAVELAAALQERVPAGMNMAQMALRWILDQPAVSTVIAGASRPEQVADNAAVSALPPLSPELHADLAAFYATTVEPEIRVPI